MEELQISGDEAGLKRRSWHLTDTKSSGATSPPPKNPIYRRSSSTCRSHWSQLSRKNRTLNKTSSTPYLNTNQDQPGSRLLRDAINNNLEKFRLPGTTTASSSSVASTSPPSHFHHAWTRTDSGFQSDCESYFSSSGASSPSPLMDTVTPLHVMIIGGPQVGKSGLTVRYLSKADSEYKRSCYYPSKLLYKGSLKN